MMASPTNGALLSSRLLNNAHLRRYPHSSSVRRTSMYASLFGILGALHLDVFEQPEHQVFSSNPLAPHLESSFNISAPHPGGETGRPLDLVAVSMRHNTRLLRRSRPSRPGRKSDDENHYIMVAFEGNFLCRHLP